MQWNGFPSDDKCNTGHQNEVPMKFLMFVTLEIGRHLSHF